VNGYVASHIADQLLAHGYAVRGTARDETKLHLALTALRTRHPHSVVEGVVVPDMAAEHAFDAAVAHVDGVAHVATDVSFSPEPDVVVRGTVAGVLNVLRAAAQSPSVKRVVYTSASIATAHPKADHVFHVDVE
jgi:nucleoside-diphosphate-sugar epimerase